MDSLSPVSAALLHGLWQGFVVAAIVCFALRWILAARHRYALLWGAMSAVVMLPFAYYVAAPSRVEAFIAAPGVATPTVGPSINWAQSILLFWACGAVYGIVRLFIEWVRVHTFSRTCEPACPELREVRDRVLERMAVRRYVRVRTSHAVQAPATIGTARPIVVWPAGGFDRMSDTENEAFMAHELAHIQRNDYALHLLQRALEALMWCNPAALWIGARLRHEREKAADELAAEALQTGKGLAIALGRLAIQNSGRAALSLAADDGDVQSRMRSLAIWKPQKMTLRSGFGIAITLVLLGAVTFVAAKAAASTKTATVYVSPVHKAYQNGLLRVTTGEAKFQHATISPGRLIDTLRVVEGRNLSTKQMIFIRIDSSSEASNGHSVSSTSAVYEFEKSGTAGFIEVQGTASNQLLLPLNGLP
ncbi:MAG: M48 family metalloprotease [Fimbriimonadaceae bacterium]|nr:M48 family metalloprotease [Fimbriimonadaceae bacterium]